MNMNILLVEDEKTQNDVLSNFLRYEGYTVFSAYTVGQAREFLKQQPHLLILDLMLPDENGLEFLKEIRKNSTIPVIVLTAQDDEYTQIQCFDLKADEYVDKPVSPLVMTKRIKVLLNRVYQNEDVIMVNGYQVNFQKFTVYGADGQEIKMTTRELNILKLLYENHGRTVTRDGMLDAVWGNEYIGEDRLIDTHIKNIRHKLGADAIVTVKGVGYRLKS